MKALQTKALSTADNSQSLESHILNESAHRPVFHTIRPWLYVYTIRQSHANWVRHVGFERNERWPAGLPLGIINLFTSLLFLNEG